MRLKPSDIGSCWDHPLARMRALKVLGFNPTHILDIGAYRGAWSEVMWHVWPEAHFHLIEANEDCISYLDQTGFPYNIALLSDKTKATIYHKCQTGSGEGNGLYRESSSYPFTQTTKTTATLDTVCSGRSFGLIKIDVQGAELDVLRGGGELLSRATIVQLETQIQSYNISAPLAIEVINYMAGLGFRLYDIGEYHYNSRGMLIQADFLFARNNCGLFDLEILT